MKLQTDLNVRFMADSESEYDLPNEDENEHTNHNYEYEASPNLEGLRHVNICPAKPLNMPSVYADKRCLSMKPHLFNPKNSQLPRLGPQMQRGKSSSDSHLEFVAPGPVVDRTVKPSKTAKNSLDGPERSPKLPTRPLPRPPRAVPRCPEASHSYVSSGPDNSLHYLNMPPVKHSENDMGFWKNDQNKAFIARNDVRGPRHSPLLSPKEKSGCSGNGRNGRNGRNGNGKSLISPEMGPSSLESLG